MEKQAKRVKKGRDSEGAGAIIMPQRFLKISRNPQGRDFRVGDARGGFTRLRESLDRMGAVPAPDG